MVLAVFLFMQDATNMGNQTPSEGFGLGLPILSIIFILFADDNLVRSMDRLR